MFTRKNTKSTTVAELIDTLMEFPSDAPIDINEELLDRVRRCVCGKWFFAANKKRITCSLECRYAKFEARQ